MFKKLMIALTLIISPAALADDEADIRATIQKYFDGYGSGNVELLKEAFHQDTVIKYADLRSGKYRTFTMDQLNEFMNNLPDGWASMPKFYSLDIHGSAAQAKVSVTVHGGRLTWTDYIGLLKLDGQWKIVSKISHGDLKHGPKKPKE